MKKAFLLLGLALASEKEREGSESAIFLFFSACKLKMLLTHTHILPNIGGWKKFDLQVYSGFYSLIDRGI